jgi:hypothetical protein
VTGTTVLRAARWADVDAGEVRSPAVVVIEGNRIGWPISISVTSRCCPG